MKKILLSLLLLTVFLTGCGSNDLFLTTDDYEEVDLLKNNGYEDDTLKIEVIENPKIIDEGQLNDGRYRLLFSPIKLKITNKTDKTLYLPTLFYNAEWNGNSVHTEKQRKKLFGDYYHYVDVLVTGEAEKNGDDYIMGFADDYKCSEKLKAEWKLKPGESMITTDNNDSPMHTFNFVTKDSSISKSYITFFYGA